MALHLKIESFIKQGMRFIPVRSKKLYQYIIKKYIHQLILILIMINLGIPPKFRGQMWLAMTSTHKKSSVFVDVSFKQNPKEKEKEKKYLKRLKAYL